jgi:hypothetical protein
MFGSVPVESKEVLKLCAKCAATNDELINP